MNSSANSSRSADSPIPALALSAAKHDRIIPVAVDLFAERGYDNVTMDEVAAAAGISRRSLFRHFRQKEEFLGRWMARFNHQLCDAIVAQAPGIAPLKVFRRALDAVDEIGSAVERLPILARITAQSASARAAMISAERGWEDAVAMAFERRGEPAPRARIAAALGMVGLRIAVAEWLALPAEQASRTRLAAGLDAAFAQIVATAGP